MKNRMESRREFLRKIIMTGGILALGRKAWAGTRLPGKHTEDPSVTIYRAINGSPAMNLAKVIELMGGIEKLIGPEDVVVIKPNVQWWNHGVPNLSAVKAFVDLIMERPGGFCGEVVLAENCHRGARPWTSMHSGWKPVFSRNSDLRGINNYNDLSAHLKKQYGDRFTTCHWIDVDAGGKRIFGPADGTGYVYCDGTGGVALISFDNGAPGNERRAVIMTYPVFRTDKGTVVDLKNGIWEKGAYTGQPLRFVNFPALNHHGTYCGATSAVKNYLGISDLSGGPDPDNGGLLTEKYYNFHSFPFNKWSPGPEPGMLGAEIAAFMNTIRKPDLNITSAEWIGLSSRTEPPVAHTRTILACTDPVALDYHACKYLLYPNSGLPIHNPDDDKRPLHEYLARCAQEHGGIFDEKHVAVSSYDFRSQNFQDDNNLVVTGNIKWGTNIKSIMKYLVLRFL